MVFGKLTLGGKTLPLFGRNLGRTNLVRVSLSGANLSKAYISDAYFRAVDLSKADLSGANLIRVDLSNVNLSGANLEETNLSGTYLNNVNLSGANLSGAMIADTVFAVVDLRRTQGLVEIDHRGPSHVELYSVQLPQDGTAVHFLRGAGVPDEWISFYRANMMHPIQYHSCLISYSSKDDVLAHRLHADLQDRGVRCWFAPEDMKIGDKIRYRIDESIRMYDKLLLVLSEHSVQSQWVEQEVKTALAKEREGQPHVLFPIRLDEKVMQMTGGWPALIRNTRHIGDFTGWKSHDDYQQALQRLLRDLKAEA